MKRALLFSVTLFVLTIGVAQAVPVRPLYEPRNTESERFDFRGTVWQSKTYEGWVMTLVFEPSGVLQFTYNGTSSTAGSWRAESNALYMEMNKKYCEFHGARVGNTISGDSWNVTGLRWKTHLTQVPSQK